jgi:hypothetical protein
MTVVVRNEGRDMSERVNLKGLLTVFAFLLVLVSIATGRTIYVDDDGPADFNNIQAAINDSNNGDTIIVADGIYTGEGNRDIELSHGLPHGQTRAITVRSANGPENCIIDCNGTESEPHRGFYFHNNEDANSVLDGFTITNGLANDLIVPFGGGIYGNGTKATIQNNHIVNNVAFTSSFPTVAIGGGLYDCDGIIQHNIISENSAVAIDMESYSKGGGLYGCDGTIKNNIISKNSAVFGGGMEIYLSNPIISRCDFTDNIANLDGGGVYNAGGNPKVTNCTFNGNVAIYGAGMYNRTDGSPILKNCTFSGNEAILAGGIYNRSDCEPNLINCILWGNTPDQIYGGTPTVTYSDVLGGWTGLGNIDADPCFADPCNDDYHLKSQAGRWDPNVGRWTRDVVTSPCIDAGDIDSPIGLEPFPNGGRVNIGAFGGTAEAIKSYFGGPVCEIIVAGDINGDCIVNFKDFALIALQWLRDENQ